MKLPKTTAHQALVALRPARPAERSAPPPRGLSPAGGGDFFDRIGATDPDHAASSRKISQWLKGKDPDYLKGGNGGEKGGEEKGGGGGGDGDAGRQTRHNMLKCYALDDCTRYTATTSYHNCCGQRWGRSYRLLLGNDQNGAPLLGECHPCR